MGFYEAMGFREEQRYQEYNWSVYCEDADGHSFRIKVKAPSIYDAKNKARREPGFKPGASVLSVEKTP